MWDYNFWFITVIILIFQNLRRPRPHPMNIPMRVKKESESENITFQEINELSSKVSKVTAEPSLLRKLLMALVH